MTSRKVLCSFLSFGVFLVLLSSTLSAEGQIIRVTQKGAGLRNGSSWANACDEDGFPLALSKASVGTEFWVAKGRYRPDTQGRVDRSFLLPPGVALYGGFAGFEHSVDQRDPEVSVTVLTGDLGLDDTVNSNGVTEKVEDIAGQNSHTVMRCGSDPEATVFSAQLAERPQSIIDGFVITAGNTGEGGSLSRKTGGLDIENRSVVVRACSFTGNAGNRGGSLRSIDSATLVDECTFSSNYSYTSGGGINGYDITVTDCVFSGNGSHNGGGMIAGGEFTVTGCIFRENFSENNPGIDRTGGGGGLYCNLYSRATIKGCTFIGNRAEREGGGIYSYIADSILVENCTFYGNRAGTGGGFWQYPRTGEQEFGLVRNCTFYENTAVNEWSEMYTGEAVNCIFWEENPGEKIIYCTVTYSIIAGGHSGEGNLDTDPRLGSPAWNGGPTMTCALLPGSPAIDSGTSAGAPEKDQRGIDRPQQSGFDRGAYEASLRKYLVMKAPFPGAFRFSTEAEEFESGEGTAWGFPEGVPVTVTFLPQVGKTVRDVLIDRQSVGAVRSYTFPNLDRDHEIEVFFTETASSSGGGGCSHGGSPVSAFLLIPLFLLIRSGKRAA